MQPYASHENCSESTLRTTFSTDMRRANIVRINVIFMWFPLLETLTFPWYYQRFRWFSSACDPSRPGKRFWSPKIGFRTDFHQFSLWIYKVSRRCFCVTEIPSFPLVIVRFSKCRKCKNPVGGSQWNPSLFGPNDLKIIKVSYVLQGFQKVVSRLQNTKFSIGFTCFFDMRKSMKIQCTG